MNRDDVAQAIIRTFESEAVCATDANNANVVDAIASLSRGAHRIADALAGTPDTGAGTDAFGGHIESICEVGMGMTEGFKRIGLAIEELADAVRSTGGN